MLQKVQTGTGSHRKVPALYGKVQLPKNIGPGLVNIANKLPGFSTNHFIYPLKSNSKYFLQIGAD